MSRQQELPNDQLDFVLAYVESVPRSAALYSRVLGLAPVESSPNFALFVLPSGLKLGLWARHEVEPRATAPGGVELAVDLADEPALRLTLAAWTEAGLDIVQQPTKMDFGLTFTAADPDGHRLRAYVRA